MARIGERVKHQVALVVAGRGVVVEGLLALVADEMQGATGGTGAQPAGSLGRVGGEVLPVVVVLGKIPVLLAPIGVEVEAQLVVAAVFGHHHIVVANVREGGEHAGKLLELCHGGRGLHLVVAVHLIV